METFRTILEEDTEHRCEGEVVLRGLNFYKTRECPNKGTIERDGKWYCKTHDPIRIKEKRAIRYKKREENQKKKQNLYLARIKAKQELRNK